MKTILSTWIFLFISTVCFSQSDNSPISVFQKLDTEVKKHSWGVNNTTKAEIFESIYKQNYEKSGFLELLDKYCDSSDKCYWIGTYLYDPDYTKIENTAMAMKILQKGIKLCKNEEETTSFYWTIAIMLYINNQREDSKKYFIIANQLSEKYPANRPAQTREFSEELDNFMSTFIQ